MILALKDCIKKLKNVPLQKENLYIYIYIYIYSYGTQSSKIMKNYVKMCSVTLGRITDDNFNLCELFL